jgi:hypothetical protein
MATRMLIPTAAPKTYAELELHFLAILRRPAHIRLRFPSPPNTPP